MTLINKIMKFSAFILTAFAFFYLLFFVMKSSFKTESTIEQEEGNKKYFFETGIDLSIVNEFSSHDIDKIINYFSSSKDWTVYNKLIKGSESTKDMIYLSAKKRKGMEELIFVFKKIDVDFENFNMTEVEEKPLVLTYETIKRFSKDENTDNYVNYCSFNNILRGKEISVIIRPIELYRIGEFSTILDIIKDLKNLLIILKSYVNSKNIDECLEMLPDGSFNMQKNNTMNVYHNDFNRIGVNGYVNMGVKGSVFITVKCKEKNTDFSFSDRSKYHEEFVGWSEKEIIKFYFDLDLQPVYGEVGDEKEAIIQLWFIPFDKAERLLIDEKDVNIKFTEPRGAWR